MGAALRTFVMLWLPGVLVLIGGLPALLRTGQVDPIAWALLSLLLVPTSAALTVWRGVRHAVWAGVGAWGALLLFLVIAAARAPEPLSAGWLTATVSLAVTGGSLLAGRPRLGGGLCVLALLFCWLAPGHAIKPIPPPRPVAAVISSLPLFWQEGGRGLAVRADAPIVTVLRQRFDVRPLDSPLAPELARADALLLAQPRAMSPAELAALDAWVRAGGRAVILADPLLRWPSPLSLGDRRRPPAVSLLAPLMAHWGLRLSPPSGGLRRQFLRNDGLLTGFAMSRFEGGGRSCRLEEAGLLARCVIGRGKALLIADADLLDDRLWLADPIVPLDSRQWTADTPAFIAAALDGGEMTQPRRWLRSERELRMGVRWALLLGIVWAALGCALFGRGRGGIAARFILAKAPTQDVEGC